MLKEFWTRDRLSFLYVDCSLLRALSVRDKDLYVVYWVGEFQTSSKLQRLNDLPGFIKMEKIT